MWHRDDPGDPPSPDPAAAAEEYFNQLSLHEPPEDDRCPDCHDQSWYVGREPNPEHLECGGTGFYLGHTETCINDECALNGDLFSCEGAVQPCDCTIANCRPCSVRERDAEVADQKTLPTKDEDTECPF
jgi:hypothetical protein